MEKASRFVLVSVAILAFAWMLPKLYWMVFEKSFLKPFVLYSCIDDDFMIAREAEKKWSDTKGKVYTREQYEQRLPLLHFKQLITDGTMPDSVKGLKIEMPEIARWRSFLKLEPRDVNAPAPVLYPLFESQPGRVSFELPEDVFRITWRIEFIDVATNQINEEKSQRFSAALYHNGFSFPSKLIAGIPLPRKSVDEGYLVVDSKDQLFHLKMVEGKPYIRKGIVPEGVKFKFINCVDFKSHAFYAYLFSDQNEVYVLTQDDYQLIRWPVEGIDPTAYSVKIYGDIFNYNLILEGDGLMKIYALDINYNLVKSYSETWTKKNDRSEGQIFAWVFPAQVSFTSEKSSFVAFDFSLTDGFRWLYLNLLLTALQLGWVVFRRLQPRKHLGDFVIVALTGIYGFLAVNFFPNKFHD